jgi:hypothetical protein
MCGRRGEKAIAELIGDALGADAFHEGLQCGALFAGGWEMGKSRQAAKVAVEVAGKFEEAGVFFSEPGGFAQPQLLLCGEGLV